MCRDCGSIPVLLLLLAFAAAGCGPIPTDPDADTTLGDRVYANKEWGFQITIPDDSTWSWTAQTFYQDREPNGLPRVTVWIYKRPRDGGEFRPTLTLEPRALLKDDTLEKLVASLEENLKASSDFRGYTAAEKQTMQVASNEAVEWTFRTFARAGLGNRFLVTVVVHGRHGYLIMGDGVSSYFPVDEFRGIISSLRFLK